MNRYILEAHVCVILCFQSVSIPVKRHAGCKLGNMRILSTFEWLAISLSSLANATTSIHISPFLMPIYFLAQFRIFHSISFQFSVLSLLVPFFSIFPSPPCVCLSPRNINSQCKSATANWYWINYVMFGCVCVCALLILLHVSASLQRNFTHRLPLLIYCCSLCLFCNVRCS